MVSTRHIRRLIFAVSTITAATCVCCIYTQTNSLEAPIEIRRRQIIGTHNGPVRSLVFLPNGRLLASGGADSLINIWNLNTNSLVVSLRGHESDVCAVVVTSDGNHLVSGSDDCRVMIWDTTSWGWLASRADYKSGVYQIAISPNGKLLATGSGSGEGLLRVMELPSLRTVVDRHIDQFGIRSLAFSRDGSRIAVLDASGDTVSIRDTATGTPVMEIGAGFKGGGKRLVFSSTGTSLLTGLISGQIQFWDMMTGRELWTIQAHRELLSGMVVSEPFGLLISAGSDETNRSEIKIWRLSSHSLVATLIRPSGLSSIALSPKGQTFAVGYYTGDIELVAFTDFLAIEDRK